MTNTIVNNNDVANGYLTERKNKNLISRAKYNSMTATT